MTSRFTTTPGEVPYGRGAFGAAGRNPGRNTGRNGAHSAINRERGSISWAVSGPGVSVAAERP